MIQHAVDEILSISEVTRAALLGHFDLDLGGARSGTAFAKQLAGITDKDLDAFAEAAFLLSQNTQATPLPFSNEQLNSYTATLDELLAAVSTDPEIGDEDRKHILKLLERLAEALRKAGVDGIEPIEAAIRDIVADITLRRDLWARVVGQPWVKKLVSITTAIAILCGAYPGAKELVGDLLPDPPAITSSPTPSEEPYEGEIVEETD